MQKTIVLGTEICITTLWKTFVLLNSNYNTTLFYFEGIAEMVAVECSHCIAAPKCFLAVPPYGALVPVVKLWELSLDMEKGIKKENLVKDFFFLILKLGQELSTQGSCVCDILLGSCSPIMVAATTAHAP